MNPLSDQYSAIKAAISITEIAGLFVPLKKRGSSYIGKCPFHNEHTPSFSVNPAKGLYHCFGCDAKGDTIHFVQQYLQLGFKEAMQWLGDHYHIPVTGGAQLPAIRPVRAIAAPPVAAKPSYIADDVFTASLRHDERNHFVQYLWSLFSTTRVNQLTSRYYIGTSDYYEGGCVFWQVDGQGKVRTGKIMPYDPVTGHRIREATPPATWVHSALKLPAYSLKQCLFGEHLLPPDLSKPIAIAESEKTAIIASVYIPQYIWLACGGKGNLTAEKCQCLAGRNVTLFPDLGALEEWTQAAKDLSHITTFTVNNLLQTASNAYHLPDKSDLCDYLTGPQARRELMDRFKHSLDHHYDQSPEGQMQVWKTYRYIGLHPLDCITACGEMIREGKYEWRERGELNKARTAQGSDATDDATGTAAGTI